LIVNIIDHRKHQHRWTKITAIVEPTCHDNSIEDADQAEWESDWSYDEKVETSLEEANEWGNSFSGLLAEPAYQKFFTGRSVPSEGWLELKVA